VIEVFWEGPPILQAFSGDFEKF